VDELNIVDNQCINFPGSAHFSWAHSFMLTPLLVPIDGAPPFAVDKSKIVIGRSKQRADLRIEDPHVSSVHCEVHFSENVLTVVDKSKHGTLVNDKPISETTVSDGDVLQILSHEFRIDWNPELSEMTSREWLIRMAGMELGPMAWDELEEMVKRGEVRQDDQISAAETDKWQTVASLEQLFGRGATADTNERVAENKRDPDKETAFEIDADTQEFELPSTDEIQDDSEHDSSTFKPSAGEPDNAEGDTVGDAQSLNDTTTDFSNLIATSSSTPVEHTASLDGFDDTDQQPEKTTETRPTDDKDLTGSSTAVEPPDRISDQARTPSTTLESQSDVDRSSALYFYRVGAIEDGPVPLPILRQLVANGSLTPLSEVQEVDGEWGTAASVPDLFQVDSVEYDDDYDANLLAESDSRDAANESGSDTTHAVRRVKFLGPSGSALVTTDRRRRAGRFGFGQRVRGVIENARATPIAAVICILGLGILIYYLVPKFDGVHVRGMVTLDGSPMKKASITFHNVETGLGTTVEIADDGNYEATTLEGGLQPGSYKVCFMPSVRESPDVVLKLQQIFQQERGLRDDGMAAAGYLEGDTKPEYKTKIRLPPGTIPAKYRTIEFSGIEREIKPGIERVSFALKTD
jgi:hypothetical protein